ncbi:MULTISPECIES: hypothetical protein [unclassified Microbacterium]|uniref:hypothetical protein n=1 Tax=unclassified Microbacterium TaxID=2609290 RepID=UPI0025D74803|nr:MULTISPECIES: hypothetical protein [unclassified Microbacterium]
MLLQFPGDPLEFATRNCPGCLSPLEARSFGWWCPSCEAATAPDESSAVSDTGASIEHLYDDGDDNASSGT